MVVLILILDDLSNKAKQGDHSKDLAPFMLSTATIDFLEETTATMSLLEYYKNSLHKFDTQCLEVAHNGKTNRRNLNPP